MSGPETAALVGLVFALLAVCVASARIGRGRGRIRGRRLVEKRLDQIVDELRGISDELGAIRARGEADAPAPVDLYRN